MEDDMGGDSFISEVRDEDGTTVVALGGELDLTNADAMRTVLEAASADAASLVVDLADVSFLDSTALGVLVGTWRTTGAETSVRLRNPSPKVTRLLSVTGMDRLFEIEDQET